MRPSPASEASTATRFLWATKHALKSSLNTTIQSTGLYRPMARLRGNRATVLFYRAVGEPDSLPICSSNIIPTEEFRRQMRYLAEHRHVVSLTECLDAIDSTGAPPEKATVLTFDDGFACIHGVVAPILQEYGLPATFFVVTGFTETEDPKWDDFLRGVCDPFDKWIIRSTAQELDTHLESIRSTGDPELIAHVTRRLREAMLTFDQMRELDASGFSVQSHGFKHWYMSSQSRDCQEVEIERSKQILEKEIGQPVRYFSVPFGYPGSFNRETVELLQEHGYEASFGGHLGYLTPRSDRFAMPRFPMNNGVDFERFRLIASGCYI